MANLLTDSYTRKEKRVQVLSLPDLKDGVPREKLMIAVVFGLCLVVALGLPIIYSGFGIYASLTYLGAIITLIAGIVSQDADQGKPRLRTRRIVIAALLLFLIGVPGYFALSEEYPARKEMARMQESQTAFWEEYKNKNCRIIEGLDTEIVYACEVNDINYRVSWRRAGPPSSFVYIHQAALRERFKNEGFSDEAIDGFLPSR